MTESQTLINKNKHEKIQEKPHNQEHKDGEWMLISGEPTGRIWHYFGGQFLLRQWINFLEKCEQKGAHECTHSHCK